MPGAALGSKIAGFLSCEPENNKSDYKLSPVVDPQVFHFVQVPLPAMKSQ
jgi:hypothetical protein